MKSLLSQTLTSLTTHLQTELESSESECARLRKEKEFLEKEIIKMRYERDLARGRVSMVLGRVGSVEVGSGKCMCGQTMRGNLEEPDEERDFEEGEEGFTMLRHVLKRPVLPKSSRAASDDDDDDCGSEDMDLETDSDSDSDSKCGSK